MEQRQAAREADDWLLSDQLRIELKVALSRSAHTLHHQLRIASPAHLSHCASPCVGLFRSLFVICIALLCLSNCDPLSIAMKISHTHSLILSIAMCLCLSDCDPLTGRPGCVHLF